MLFATGALGVLLRRSPLIILLSVEIMLNARTCALIAFSRLHGQRGRPDLRDRGDGGRCVRGRRRARPDRRDGPAQHRARRRQAPDPARVAPVNAAAWICLLLPLAATLAITLGGTALSRRARRLDLDGDDVRRVRRPAVVAFVADARRERRATARTSTTSWTWLSAGQYHFGFTLLVDQLSVMMMLIVAGVGGLIIAYSLGYMDGEDEERRYFAYMSLFVFSMLLLVAGRQPAAAARGLGHGRPLELPADRLLPGAPFGDRGREEGVRDERVGDATMALALFLLVQHTGSLDYSTVFAVAPHGGTIANLIALGLLGGAVAKSRPDPAAHLAPRRDGGPDAGERPDPRGDDGDGGRVPDRALAHPLFENAALVQDMAAALGAVTLLMAGLIALVQVDIKRVIAYSTMSQIGYMFVARRDRDVRERDVPPDDARVLQGAALPRRRAS